VGLECATISNLLFLDGTLTLLQSNPANANCLKNILDHYCLFTVIREDKSSIFFSVNALVKRREETCTVSRYCDMCSYTDKYLHLPALVGMDRSDCFQFLVARVCKRINSWMETILSAGGTELLPMRQHMLYQHM
jgi:hypothetical protein